ncbi:hypothetical protein GQX74_001540 [Glossina fuscipes]|nr:hypothetical protein GQX74_001540 [Glossina fuscipes]
MISAISCANIEERGNSHFIVWNTKILNLPQCNLRQCASMTTLKRLLGKDYLPCLAKVNDFNQTCFDVVVHNVNIHVTYSLKWPVFSVYIFGKQPIGKILISQRHSVASNDFKRQNMKTNTPQTSNENSERFDWHTAILFFLPAAVLWR